MTTININLLPEELRPRAAGSRGGGGPSLDREVAVPIAVGVVAAIVIAAVPTMINMFWLDAREADLVAQEEAITNEISTYQTTLKKLKDIADQKEALRAQLSTLQSVAGVSTSWGDMLNEMRSLTPANLWFEDMSSDTAKGEVTFSGGALDYSSVAFFQHNLQNAEFFENPVLSGTSVQPTRGINVVKFEMTVTVRKKV